MIGRARVALAMGGLFIILLSVTAETAEAAQHHKSPTSVIDHYRQVIANDPDNLTFHYLLGVALLQNNANEEALSELTIAYPAYQESIEAHYNLAIATLRLGDLPSTEIYLEQAIALGANDMQGIYPLASLFFNMALTSQNGGDANEAIRYFHRALNLDPNRTEVYRQLGSLYSQLGETDFAIKAFTSYLEVFPDDQVSRDYLFALEFNRAQDFLAAKNYKEAEEGFNSALQLQPDSPTVLYYLGYLAYSQGQTQLAASRLIDAFGSADPELQQTIRPLLYNTALALRETGSKDSALQTIAVIANHKHAHFEELFLAGTIALEMDSYRSAHDYLQRATEKKPEDVGARQNLMIAEQGAFEEWVSIARVKLDQKYVDEADDTLENALLLKPGNAKVAALKVQLSQAREQKADALFSNARRSLDAGDVSKALEQINEGLHLRPSDSNALSLREEIRQAMSVDLDQLLEEGSAELLEGNLGSAEMIFKRILAVSPQQQQALEGITRIQQTRQAQITELLSQAQDAVDSGKPAEAIKLFNQLLAIEPENETARQGLTSAMQIRDNRIDELIRKGRTAIDSDQFSEARQWFEKARGIEDSDRIDNELKTLDSAVQKRADDYVTQARKGLEKDHFQQAETLYLKALDLIPDHSKARDGLTTLVNAKQKTIANKLNLADASLQKRDFAKAMNGYRSVLKIAPKNNQAIAGLQKCREAQAEALNQLIKQGEEALNKGDYEKADRLLAEALEQDAYHKQAQHLRQRLSLVQQTGAKPGDEQKLYLQGVAFYTQGKYAEAIKSWETVLLLNPNHEKSHQNLAKTRLKLQQIKEFGDG